MEKLSRELTGQYLEGEIFDEPEEALEKLYALYEDAFGRLAGFDLGGSAGTQRGEVPYTLPLTVYLEDSYYLVDPGKTAFRRGYPANLCGERTV